MYDLTSIVAHVEFCYRNNTQFQAMLILLDLYQSFAMPSKVIAKRMLCNDLHAACRIGTKSEVLFWINHLTSQGLLFKCEKKDLIKIKKYLKNRGINGPPVGGMPQTDDIDLTVRGAELLREYVSAITHSRDRDVVCFAYHERDRATVFSTSSNLINSFIEDQSSCNIQIISRSRILKIGCWTDRWWRSYSVGYKMDFRYQENS